MKSALAFLMFSGVAAIEEASSAAQQVRSKIKAGMDLRETLGVDAKAEAKVFETIGNLADNMGFSVTADGQAYVSWKQFNESIMPVGYDIDGDGRLTLEEMHKSEFAAPSQEIFNKADKNGDGHISGHDWIELAKEYDPKHKGIPGIDELSYRDMTQIAHHTVRTSQKNFDHMDQDDDGRVTLEELKNVPEPDFDEWAKTHHEDADYLAWNLLQRQGGGSILKHKDVHSLLELAAEGGGIDDIQQGLRLLKPEKLAMLQDWMDDIHESAIDHMEWHTTHMEHGFDIDL